jgi:hypothetical protein
MLIQYKMSEPTLQDLMNEILELKTEIRELKEICSRMNSHITFVEGVYDTLKTPLDYIALRFNGISGLLTP